MSAPGYKYCHSCAQEIKEEAEICPSCGVRQKPANNQTDDSAELLPKAASCCIPVVGLVLYLLWKDTKPKAAKDVCTWAWIGVGASVVCYGAAAVLGVLSELM